MTIKNQNTIYQLSYLRVIACIAIIVLHTTFAANEYFIDTISNTENIVSRAVEHNMMWAVPVFLMVTGALLLSPARKLTYEKLYGKYVKRMVLTIVIFSIIFKLLDMAMGADPATFKSFLTSFGEMFTGSSWGHMWYLYLLVGLYVLLPFYKKIAEHSTDKELLYLAGVYTFFISILGALEIWDIECGFYICTTIVYPLYLFLGHMIYEQRLHIGLRLGVLLTLVSTVLLVILTVFNTDEGLLDYFFEYYSIVVIIQTVGVFSIVNALWQGKTIDSDKPSKLNKIISSMDDCSFGIYLWHMAGVRFLFRAMGFNPYPNGGALTIAGVIIAIFIASYVLTWVLKKIPGVNKIL